MQLLKKIIQQLDDPKNLEIVNGGQSWFVLGHRHVDNSTWVSRLQEWTTDLIYLDEGNKLFAIRHCINLLPCFELEINQPPMPFSFETPDPIHRIGDAGYKEALQKVVEGLQNGQIKMSVKTDYIPQTIRQALLCSGAMTVEELEQEYLKLIN